MRWELYRADGCGGTWLATFDRKADAKAAARTLAASGMLVYVDRVEQIDDTSTETRFDEAF